MTNEVDDWFAERQHPLTDAMQLARKLILEADSRVSESIKWKTPTFSYQGNIVSFNPSTTSSACCSTAAPRSKATFLTSSGTAAWYGSCASRTSTKSRPRGTNSRR